VAAFDLDVDARRLDFRLMVNGFVTLFWRVHLLAEATEWMRKHGYTIKSLNAGGWDTDEDLHRDMAAALDFPDYYGRNLDALNDCMRDVVDYACHDSRRHWSPDHLRRLRRLRPQASANRSDRPGHHGESGPTGDVDGTPNALPGPER
jgi:hypothetical protein